SDQVSIVLAMAIAIGSFGLFALFLVAEWNNPNWSKVIFDHFAATIGLPMAAAAAFLVVSFFKTVDGPIKIEVLGLKFEGASGPILMWVIVFGAITGGIAVLW
ncbi:MAG: hypothetical protein AAFY81_08955, partial [Pseudomonadota bacterium]